MSGPDAEPLGPAPDEAAPPMEGKDEPEVSQSLVGLMGAFDQLREAVGYSVQDSAEFAAIERFVQDIEAENAQLRLHAVEAIEVAERMREENSTLMEELTASRVGTMVEQAAELDKVTREYDQELMKARVEEAEAVLEEVTELRGKVAELEDENTGLTEMLNELRQTQQQLSRLQLMEQTGTSDFAAAEAAESSRGLTTPVPAAAAPADDEEGASPPYKTPVEASLMPETTPPPSAALNGTPAAAAAATPGSTAKDPEAVAEALSAVAGGSAGGVAAAAARMLRDYAGLQASLESERASKAALQEEVARLNEITSAKTFKAPSAWAEREVKYRQEKQQWQEEQKETERRLAAAREELDALRGTSGAAALERRMEELEARLLESERDRDVARSALHEMEIASKARSGEFSLTGVKPYTGPRHGEEGEVQQVVATMESSGGGTPGRPSPATPAVGWVGESATPRADEPATGDLRQQLAALQRENVHLKATLEKAGLGAATALDTPQVVRQALSSSTVKKAKDLEDQLATTQQERAALLAELEELKAAAAARGAEEAQRVTLQLRVAETETRTEMALLQRGVDSDSARELAALAAQLREAQRREAAALATVEALKAEADAPAAPEAADADSGDEDALPPASAFQEAFERQQKEQAAEDEAAAAKKEQGKIQEEMQRVASTAVVVPELLHAPVLAPGDEDAESVPEEIAPLLEEAATAAAAAAPAPAAADGDGGSAPAAKQEGLSVESMERIQSLQTQLRAAEAALAALEKGAVPVQMHISVAEVKQGQEGAPAPAASAADPVQMRISVTEGPDVTSVKLPITLASGEEAVASIHMPININAPPSPVRMAINVAEAAPAAAAAPASSPVRMAINVAEAPAPAVHLPITVTEAAEGAVHMPISVAEGAAAATPVNLAINVAEGAESVTRVSMPINVAGDAPKASPRVMMPITLAGDAPKASPRVSMSINVAGDAPAPVQVPISVPEEPVTRVELPITVGDAAAPVRIPITIAGDPAKERRMRQLEALLRAANEEEDRLRRDLESLAPVRLNFNVGGGGVGASPPATGMSRRSSAASMEYSSEGLARDRAAAEAAYQDHVKATDAGALLRAKAELETQVAMLQSQLEKAQGALSAADEEHEKIKESIDDAMRRGDVGLLAGLKEGLRGSKARLGGRSFKVFGKRGKDKDKAGVTDQDIKTALHDTQDALTEAEAERNALRRQLARMNKKMEKNSGPGGAEGAAVGAAGGSAPDAAGSEEERGDANVELSALRDENEMIMEHLVVTKVRLAEVEGDFLESRRALLRSREKQLQLARQIMELQAAEMTDMAPR